MNCDPITSSGERGAALLITLLTITMISALAVCVLDTSMTETAIAANYAASQQALYTADAGIERALADLLDVPDWNSVLAGLSSSGFVDNGGGILPDGRPADVAARTRAVQAESDTFYGAGPNRPVWQPYARGPLSSLVSGAEIPLCDYVLVWVADDPEETDGNPRRDTNRVVLLRADGYSGFGTRRVVEAAVRRRPVPPAETTGREGESEPRFSTRVLWWRDGR